MTLVKRWGLWGVVVCLLGAAGLVLFVPWLIRLRYALLIVAAVLLVVTLALNWREGASLLGRRGIDAAVGVEYRAVFGGVFGVASSIEAPRRA